MKRFMIKANADEAYEVPYDHNVGPLVALAYMDVECILYTYKDGSEVRWYVEEKD